MGDCKGFGWKEPYERLQEVLLEGALCMTTRSLARRSPMGDLREFDREFRGGLQVANLKMRSFC